MVSVQKNQGFQLNNNIMIYICDYIHPYLRYVVLKNESNLLPAPKVPIELLISWNNSAVLDEFKNVLLNYNFRTTLATKVARYGNYSTIKWFQSKDITINESLLLPMLASRGDVELFSRISEEMSPIKATFESAFVGAAQFGHLNILQWAQSKTILQFGKPICIAFLEAASQFGRMDILEWYYRAGHMDIGLKWIDNWAGIGYLHHVFDAAVYGNKFQILLWIKSFMSQSVLQMIISRRTQFCPVGLAASYGNLSMLTWFIEQGRPYNKLQVITAAASGGNLDILQYCIGLLDNGLDIAELRTNSDVCIKAAEHGHLELLQWAKSKGCYWPAASMFPAAAKFGNDDINEWLLKLQCPFEEERSFMNACKRGYFEFVKFARANGSKVWNTGINFCIQDQAALRGDLGTILWAREQCVQADDNWLLEALITTATSRGHIHILEWLRNEYLKRPLQRCFISDCNKTVLQTAAENGHLHILDWGLSNGLKCDWNLISVSFFRAVNKAYFPVLIWFQTNFPQIISSFSAPIQYAARKENIEVFKWLRYVACHPDTYADAIKGSPDIEIWAIRNGCTNNVVG